jgi:hypothetical protein
MIITTTKSIEAIVKNCEEKIYEASLEFTREIISDEDYLFSYCIDNKILVYDHKNRNYWFDNNKCREFITRVLTKKTGFGNECPRLSGEGIDEAEKYLDKIYAEITDVLKSRIKSLIGKIIRKKYTYFVYFPLNDTKDKRTGLEWVGVNVTSPEGGM